VKVRNSPPVRKDSQIYLHRLAAVGERAKELTLQEVSEFSERACCAGA